MKLPKNTIQIYQIFLFFIKIKYIEILYLNFFYVLKGYMGTFMDLRFIYFIKWYKLNITLQIK